MHVYFLALSAQTQQAFLDHLESFVRKHRPQRFDFAYDPEGRHHIHDYRILWRASSADHIASEVGLSVVHLSSHASLFHTLLQRQIDGLFFISNAGFGDVYSEMAQMKLLVPPTLLAQPGLIQGGIYFRDDIKTFLPEDLKALSKALNLSLYTETPTSIPHVCNDIVQRLYQKVLKSKGSSLLKDQAILPI